MADRPTGCRFCEANTLLDDTPIYRDDRFYILQSIGTDRADAVMIIPHRHVVTPFDMWPEEWAQMPDALEAAKRHLEPAKPDGFTIGWNVGAAAGQHIFHAHLHVIARFANGPSAGRGIHAALRNLENDHSPR